MPKWSLYLADYASVKRPRQHDADEIHEKQQAKASDHWMPTDTHITDNVMRVHKAKGVNSYSTDHAATI